MPEAKLLAALANTRPGAIADLDHADTLFALRTLARRHRDLTAEITEIQDRMRARATAANPALLAIKGVGPVIGAQLLITAGDNPDRLRHEASFAAAARPPSPSAPDAPTGSGSPAAATAPRTAPCT